MNFIDTAYASGAEAVATTAGAGEESVFASLGLNVQQFAIQLFNFALIALIVWFMILKPLSKKLEERKKLIDDSLDKAKEIETNFLKSQTKYQGMLDSAKAEASTLIAASHTEAKDLAIRMKTEAKLEIESLVAQAKRKMASDREKMQEEIKNQVVEVVVVALEKILDEKMDSARDQKFIEETLKEVKS